MEFEISELAPKITCERKKKSGKARYKTCGYCGKKENSHWQRHFKRHHPGMAVITAEDREGLLWKESSHGDLSRSNNVRTACSNEDILMVDDYNQANTLEPFVFNCSTDMEVE